jgi:hypothetical protein
MTPIVGKTYIIKTYKDNPSGWDPNRQMMKYMGQLVTVSGIEDIKREWCKIKEDNGRWSWKFDNLKSPIIDFGIEDLFEI